MSHTTLQRAQELMPRLREIRRTIHRHPELGFQEVRTAALVAETLRSLGIRVETGIGKTGVVGTLGREGPVVALRADMDALPIQEQNQVAYRSEVPGVMHACGHDAHTACLLGAAMLLNQARLEGQVRLLFQPAEEGMDEEGQSGASRMLADGALAGVEALFALHVDGRYPAGTVACSPGAMAAAMDGLEIAVLGRAAHGAQPNLGVDAVLLAAQVVTALHTIVARRIPPLNSGVITVGMIQGGTKENILAEEVVLRGTIRSFDPEVRQTLFAEIERACGLAQALGGDYRLTIRPGYPAMVNDPALARFARQVAGELLGSEAVSEMEPEMGSEDFAFFAQQAPGCYLSLGAGVPGQPLRPAHHPTFDLDESALPVGAAMLAELARRYLEQRPLAGAA